jgi:signal transduction histidine kinase
MSDNVRIAVIASEDAHREAAGLFFVGGAEQLEAADAAEAIAAGADLVVVLGTPARVAKAVTELADGASRMAVLVCLRQSDDGDPFVAVARALRSPGPGEQGLSAEDGAALGHDLRTPLGSIVLRVDRLLRLCADEGLQACEAFGEFPHQLAVVRSEAERCAGLLALLDVTREPGAAAP